MITVISGTNRLNSRTRIIAEYCEQKLKRHAQTQFLALDELPMDKFLQGMINRTKSDEVESLIEDKLKVANLILIVAPEYNGSFPGVLKLFIDIISTYNYKTFLPGKKVGLIGVASGRAGNLRGMEHLTGILNYMGMHLYPDKLPISSIETLLDSNQQVSDTLAQTLDSYLDSIVLYARENVTSFSAIH